MFILEPGMWLWWRRVTCDQVEGQIPSGISNCYAESVNKDFGKLRAKGVCFFIGVFLFVLLSICFYIISTLKTISFVGEWQCWRRYG